MKPTHLETAPPPGRSSQPDPDHGGNRPLEPRASLARRGFTLVELLVTVAIVAVLVALVAMAAPRILERGRSAKCTNNLRQIYLGIAAFLQDNNNHYMQRYYGDETGYHEVIFPYVGKEKKIFVCPSQRYNYFPLEPGYGFNWYYDNQSTFKVERPGQTIALAETYGNMGEGSNRADRDGTPPGRIDEHRHGKTSNYLFFDGHVEALDYNETKKPLYQGHNAEGEPVAIDMWGVDYHEHSRESP